MTAKRIVLLAAENGALPNGKVGGVGDVVRDLPAALADRGWEPAVLTPAYGMFASYPGAKQLASVATSFGGVMQSADLYEVPGPDARVRHYVFDHALFSPQGPGQIYCDDGSDAPFATDASKFAFFCAAAAAAFCQGALPAPRIIHLHDWQMAMFLALREYDKGCAKLKKIRTVFTIHNLSLQGIRPLTGFDSALTTWYPQLKFPLDIVTDPRWSDCVNPMAVGIRLSDGLNTVSPTYAREILLPSIPDRGYSGGEGLEADLNNVAAKGRLAGILNGCNYPAGKSPEPVWEDFLATIRAEVTQWIARESKVSAAHYLAERRLAELPAHRPDLLLTSIGRVAMQKTRLFREMTAEGLSALDSILAKLDSDSLFIMIGSGDPEYEQFLTETASKNPNFLFLCGYSEALSRQLYASGDLFLMPSSFEPCGISQMLAMRAGQPCVVHGVGGLRDTVSDNVNGFVFDGETSSAQADNFVNRVMQALEMRKTSATAWRKMQRAAAAMRFDWDASAAAYERELYKLNDT